MSCKILAVRGTLLAIGLLCLGMCTGGRAEVVRMEGREFDVPDGFVLQRIATSELVPRPIVADIDWQGDLFVADSSGSNADVQTQLSQRPHRILRLRDTDRDGVFDQQTVFADQMMFPEGLLWHQGSVYVSAPPHIWKLTDRDGDGVAEQREVWFDGQTLTGCANDLHGPYLGVDGWIYWCKGAFAEQTYTLADGSTWTTRAAHIFRRRVEGGPIEPVMTGGMDNPVDVVFTAGGERIFTTTFLQHPAGGQRDGLIHAIYGGVYGKLHGVLDGHPRTGELMPVLSHLGPAAPCGLTRVEGDLLGAEYDGDLLSCAFNLHQVTRHVLTADEASFRCEDTAWLSTPDLDFHPTDVIQDADGSIVVIDTGGWYKLCCPSSQLHKPDVLGGIYRVSRRGPASVPDPRGLALDWSGATNERLAAWLDDPRHVVRQRAIEQLARRGAVALPALRDVLASSHSVRARCNAVWTICRIDDAAAVPLLGLASDDQDAMVRQASLHAISVRRERSASKAVVRCIADADPAVRRAAAEAAGRLDAPAAIPRLLEQMRLAQGRALEHSLVYALIDIGDAVALVAAWDTADPAARRAILVALDQMPGGQLEQRLALQSLTSSDARLRQSAIWVVSHHADWADSLAGQLLAQLPALARTPGAVDDMVPLLARFADHASVQTGIASGLAADGTDATQRHLLLQILHSHTGPSLSAELQHALAQRLTSADEQSLSEIIPALSAYARNVDQAELIEALSRLAQHEDLPAKLRLQAISALGGQLGPLADELFQVTLRTALEEEEFDLRRLATAALSGAKLTPAQLANLIDALPQAGPVELGQLVLVLKKTNDAAVAAQALARLRDASALVVVPDSVVREAFDHFDATTRQAVDTLLKNRAAGHTDQVARLQQLINELPAGDIRQGQQVFHSSKAACFTCHAMGYRGGDIGPDLTRIGRIRSRRDLLEAIVYPSASFVRSYEPLSVTTKSGLIIQGVIKDENDQRLVLVNDQRKPVEIARSEIEEAVPGQVSVMPSGLDQLLTQTELADLLAFLEAAK